MSLAARLRDLFEVTRNPATKKKYSLREVADAITASGTSITPAYLHLLREGDRKSLSLEKALGIADFFGVPVESLLDVAEGEPDQTHVGSVHPYPAWQVEQAHALSVGPSPSGGRLQVLRESHDLSPAEAAAATGLSEDLIRGVETGALTPEVGDLGALLTLYGVTDVYERRLLTTIARGERPEAWWYAYMQTLPLWLLVHMKMEDEAAQIRFYSTDAIPPLLQTEEYARASRRAAHHPDLVPAQVELGVKLIMQRQARVLAGQSVKLWAVIQESILLDAIGGVEVQARLIDHLITLSGQPNVTLQVNRTREGRYRPRGGSFSLFRFAASGRADVVYVPQMVTDSRIDDPAEVAAYQMAHTRLSLSAEPPTYTAATLQEIRDRLTETVPSV
ncbi:Scr1 family TA system antitoxin-like transcriptional regulator [Streptosporangium canum]|uniref:Scr1 family TA system antitoxin-like transcriptional regulator n=1 Tax=Streptosporangium canum TaxID=324952 RepID=UPI0036A2EE26